MADIRVQVKENSDGFACRVSVSDSQSTRNFSVNVKKSDYSQLTHGKISVEDLVRLSFEFLLRREPKESILSQFDLLVIGRYFPEFEREIKEKIRALSA